MVCLSYQSIEKTAQHTQLFSKRGASFEQMAKELEGQLLTELQASQLEDAGQKIQQQADIMKNLVERILQEKDSECLEECWQIHHHQRQVALHYIVVIQLLVEAIRGRLLDCSAHRPFPTPDHRS